MPGHEIPLSTFVRTSEQTKAVISSFNKELFDGQLQFEILVLPPAEGSFLTRLCVALGAGWLAVWTFTESDVGQVFIKGLTDHEPAYWSEMAGKAAKSAITKVNAEPTEQRAKCDFSTLIVAQSVTSFLQKPTRDLERVGLSTGRFRGAYEAKNAFYDACESTPNLRAIGFSDKSDFPISRDEFSRLKIMLPDRQELEHPWYIGTMYLRVSSPNWVRSDRARQWKGQDQIGRDRYFRIEDEEFWTRVSAETISAHIIDTMKVQLAFQGKLDQPKNCRVLRVLEFNGVELAAPLREEALLAILGRVGDPEIDQPDLFGGVQYSDWPSSRLGPEGLGPT